MIKEVGSVCVLELDLAKTYSLESFHRVFHRIFSRFTPERDVSDANLSCSNLLNGHLMTLECCGIITCVRLVFCLTFILSLLLFLVKYQMFLYVETWMNHTLGLLGQGPRVRVAWTRVCVPRDGFRFYSKVTPKTTTVAIFTHARGPALKLSRRMSESIGSDVKCPLTCQLSNTKILKHLIKLMCKKSR